MITWLTNFGYGATAKKLDTRRLVRQLRMVEDILEIVENPSSTDQQKSLPEVRMWLGWEYQLCMYGLVLANEAITVRRLHSTDTSYFHECIRDYKQLGLSQEKPPWIGDRDILRSHRSRLIIMDPEHYAALFPNTPARMPVLWPQPILCGDAGVEYRLRMKTEDIKRLNRGERVLPEHLYYDPAKNEVCKRSIA